MSLFSKIALGVFTVLAFNINAQENTNMPVAVDATSQVYMPENAGWLTNIDEAYAESKASGKPIMANFTGSDWCGWCKKLTADVFSHQEFKDWAKNNVVLLELDYPRRKTLPQHIQAQNSNLQSVFGIQGYPTVWVFGLSKDEVKNQFNVDAIGKTGYTRSVEEFTANIEQMISAKKKG
jgi:thiol:disulfide interchange protein